MSNILADAFKNLKAASNAGPKKHFLVSNGMHTQRLKDAAKRRDGRAMRKLIKAENCDDLIAAFPVDQFSILHAICGGNFVMGDIVGRIVEKRGAPISLIISTLSLSVKNCVAYAEILEKNPAMQFDLLVSDYFKNSNGEIFRAIEELLLEKFPDQFRVRNARSHAKILLFDYGGDDVICIETSANLRSSVNIEQAVVTASREVWEFHKTWILEVCNE